MRALLLAPWSLRQSTSASFRPSPFALPPSSPTPTFALRIFRPWVYCTHGCPRSNYPIPSHGCPALSASHIVPSPPSHFARVVTMCRLWSVVCGLSVDSILTETPSESNDHLPALVLPLDHSLTCEPPPSTIHHPPSIIHHPLLPSLPIIPPIPGSLSSSSPSYLSVSRLVSSRLDSPICLLHLLSLPISSSSLHLTSSFLLQFNSNS
jgi:hypothetical protein